MKIAVPRERHQGEKRVAASPEAVKKLVALGADVVIEAGAGAGADFPDAAYEDAGAAIAPGEEAALAEADVVFKVRRPQSGAEGTDEVGLMRPGATLVGLLEPLAHPEQVAAYADRGLVAFALELMPRITRAQNMDVLSSQANLAGYKAVLDASVAFGRAMPMMMTAAGTIAPARVLVLGAGVAGLQAIATARRLGAIVSAFDVRAAAHEEVESLGAAFIEVPRAEGELGEGAGGYAGTMSEDYQRRQAGLIGGQLKRHDIAICTALIPGKRAPVLITEDMVRGMKPGSVIVDLAVEAGGNCTLSKADQEVTEGGVRIIAHANVPSRIAVDASSLYARNLVNFITPLIDPETHALKIDWDDEIVRGTLLTRDGKVVHPLLQQKAA